MTLTQVNMLLFVYILSLILIITLIYLEFRRIKFNFNIIFSLLYLLTFYLGLPFTFLLTFYYYIETVPFNSLLKALLIETAFYNIYYLSYKNYFFFSQRKNLRSWLSINRTEIHLLCILLMCVSIITFLTFFIQNGFLLFKLDSYTQVFSSDIFGVALKRFFYFFIPAMLLIYFLQPTKSRWIIFFITTVIFGILTYLVVGGTRANIIIAFTLFLFIGIQRGWIMLWQLAGASILTIGSMFWLALRRYSLNINTDEIFYTFLYLTRDTFSPWENLALLLERYDQINFQGLAPIIRDFYVFIPNWLWPNKPSFVLNTANYFTWEILENHSGLTISPTLIGSFLVMGGVIFIPFGAFIVSFIIKRLDILYEYGKAAKDPYRTSLIQSFCLSMVFNMIVLVREGLDAFISRFVFFCLVFGLCLFVAKLLFLLFQRAGLIRRYLPELNN